MSWLSIVLIGIATFALRASFLLVFRGDAPPRIAAALRYVPIAVLPALATSAVIGDGSGPLDIRIAAALIAALVVWRTRSVAAAMAAGMAVLWALLWLAG